ncbi:fatty acid desaturase [Alcanivorax sp. P2S70]|uniref:fatty acid desaturase n=1 Tax=Alcanivorax sp. P2S70 TaxID=1397527 RepID=UPI0003B449B0|nr:fatty acid desaturase [Alcanivorax sp. P2S70]ERP93044.1 fatty acid desaturase [Alcanivorax sp. P2S70]
MSHADNNNELARLKVSPPLALPTIAILIVSLISIALSWVLVMNDIWPLWLGMVINSIAGYALFTPAHEAIHRAAAQKSSTNDFLLSAATFVAVPFGKGKLFRLLHMRHHRFANDPENDPDHWMASSLWTMPLWGLWPYFYLYKFLRNPAMLPNVKVSEIVREIVVAGIIFGALIAWEPFYMLTLWLIPTYFAFFLMCLVFMVLPHYPHTGRQDEDPNTTALMRMGGEWWQTPVLMYQNYHLVHHLYPTVPFYRYGKVWKAREAHHMENSGSMIIGPFGLGPDSDKANAA